MAETTGNQHLEVNGNGVHGCEANECRANGHLRKKSNGLVCQTKTESTKASLDNGLKVHIRNNNIGGHKTDILYHLGLSTRSHDLEAMFHDVKFVCVGGSVRRMQSIAYFMMRQLGIQLPVGQELVNISASTDRYAMFKVGPVITVSHGIGGGSFSVVMHELIKLLHHAKATDVCFFRLGTSGGIETDRRYISVCQVVDRRHSMGWSRLEPGTVVVSREAVDTLLRPFQELHIVGKVIRRPSTFDQQLVDELVACSKPTDQFQVTAARTMCAQDFYEGQGRLDGAFCDYTEQDKFTFLKNAHANGVRNIEMESVCFAAMCRHANIPGAVVCVTMLDRLRDDQVTIDKATSQVFEERPALIVSRLIRGRHDNPNETPRPTPPRDDLHTAQ